ncbi:Tripartite DNA replication factor [Boothiomyces sp. JEL0866]|nr:Tripartite DNA replication factor [Boothiomyces sp. JEL0866]
MKRKQQRISWLTTPPIKRLARQIHVNSSSPSCSGLEPSPLKIKKYSSENVLNPEDTASNNPFLAFLKSFQTEQKDYLRCVILQVSFSEHVILRVALDGNLKRELTVNVFDDWMECKFEPGKCIHLIYDDLPDIDTTREFNITNTLGTIVVDPDVLITSTSVSDAFPCVRKSVLKDQVKFVGPTTKAMFFGTLSHNLFQEAMEANNFNAYWLKEKLKFLIQESINDLYSLEISVEECFAELLEVVELIINWKNQNYQVKGGQIRDVDDIEERIWSPKYGIKGNIDATVLNSDNCKIPLELKTGKKRHISHNAQTSLYTLLLQDKHKIKVDKALLVYLHGNDTREVITNQNEIRGLIIARNKVAHYQATKTVPPMLDNTAACKRCFVKEVCFMYHKSVDQEESSSDLANLFNESLKTLTANQVEFVNKWIRLIDIEDRNNVKNTKYLWTVPAEKREQMKLCMSGLYVSSAKVSAGQSFKYEYTLCRNESSHAFIPLTSYGYVDGEPIIVTQQNSFHPVAIGFLLHTTKSTVTIYCDKPLQKGHQSVFDEKIQFNIDRDSYSNGMSSIRGNVFELFVDPSLARLKQLIVDLKPPGYYPLQPEYVEKYKKELNSDQINALSKVNASQDYSLLLGMPGTGKTTTIACMIEMLLKRGKSVLVVAYTHSAVDNILLKLLDKGVEFVRLGSPKKLHPKIRDIVELERESMNTLEKISNYYDSARVVATTALGVNHPLFTRRRFDYCVVDESSQIVLPICLGSLKFSDKFVLVGDHYQLPPLFAQSTDNKVEPVSLFKHLCEANPQAITYLSLQYRMNQDIMLLTNHLVYEYRLLCANDSVAKSVLEVPNLHLKDCNSQCWINRILKEGSSVLFCDTDMIPGTETKHGIWIENKVEVSLVSQLVSVMVKNGVDESDIGVISPYRHQLSLLSKALTKTPKVEALTIDKYQGRDKKCIIISMTRSNATQQTGELMKDWRRLNVAITRAKLKLVIFGSMKTISASRTFKQFLDLVCEKGWVYTLPKNAHTLHLESL